MPGWMKAVQTVSPGFQIETGPPIASARLLARCAHLRSVSVDRWDRPFGGASDADGCRPCLSSVH